MRFPRALATAAAALAAAALGGCIPTLSLKPEHQDYGQVVGMVQRFCAAVRPGGDLREVMNPRLAAALERAAAAGAAVPLTSAPAGPDCGPGRLWYNGQGRRVAEVRLQGGAVDRLDMWLHADQPVNNVFYGSPQRVAGRRVPDLKAGLARVVPAAD
jgi:hypothetical protein